MKGEMGFVGTNSQPSDDKHMRGTDQVQRRIRYHARIGQVNRFPRRLFESSLVKASLDYFPAHNIQDTVFYRYRGKAERAYPYRFLDSLGINAGFSASLLGMSKGIGEPFLEFFYGIPVTVHRHGFFMMFSAKGPQIIQPMDMIRMSMGQKYRIQSADPCPNCLEPEFRPRINHCPLSGSACYIQGGAHPLVPGILGTTYRAPASYYRNAMRSTGAKNRELHGLKYTPIPRKGHRGGLPAQYALACWDGLFKRLGKDGA
jgi:hypothetical protein